MCLWLFCDYDNQEPDAKDNHANQRPAEAATSIFVYFWILSEVRNKKHDRVGTSYFNSYLIVCCRRRIGRGIPNSRKVRVEINAEIKQSREKQEVSEFHKIKYQVRSQRKYHFEGVGEKLNHSGFCTISLVNF